MSKDIKAIERLRDDFRARKWGGIFLSTVGAWYGAPKLARHFVGGARRIPLAISFAGIFTTLCTVLPIFLMTLLILLVDFRLQYLQS
jgi:hypothetical protein